MTGSIQLFGTTDGAASNRLDAITGGGRRSCEKNVLLQDLANLPIAGMRFAK